MRLSSSQNCLCLWGPNHHLKAIPEVSGARPELGNTEKLADNLGLSPFVGISRQSAENTFQKKGLDCGWVIERTLNNLRTLVASRKWKLTPKPFLVWGLVWQKQSLIDEVWPNWASSFVANLCFKRSLVLGCASTHLNFLTDWSLQEKQK